MIINVVDVSKAKVLSARVADFKPADSLGIMAMPFCIREFQ